MCLVAYFKLLLLFIYLEIDCFHNQLQQVSIAGLPRCAGYATASAKIGMTLGATINLFRCSHDAISFAFRHFGDICNINKKI